jgi:hypothetical protein
LRIGKNKGKMQEGRGDEEMGTPKNFSPNVNKLRIGTCDDPGPISVPHRNAKKHDSKGSIYWMRLVLGIDK